MSIYLPYTYLIGWSSQNKYYYGCQYGREAHPSNLWNAYFTSSNIISNYRVQYGEPDIIQIRKTFNTAEECIRFEEKVLMKLNRLDPFCKTESKWLNSNVSGAILLNEEQQKSKGRKVSETKRTRKYTSWCKGLTKETSPGLAIISEKMKGKPKSEKHKESLRKPKSDSSKMGRYERDSDYRLRQSEKTKSQMTPERRAMQSQKAKSQRACIYCGMVSNKSNITRHEKKCSLR